MTPPLVSALSPADAPRYCEFLLEGVRAHSDALRISPEDILSAPFRLEHGSEGATLVALDERGAWLGVVTVEREQGRSKRRHVGWILRMYVRAASAGAGVGRALLRAAIQHGRSLPGVQKLNLTVAAHNERAVGLYQSEGFQVFSREEDAFRDPEPRTELTLSLRL